MMFFRRLTNLFMMSLLIAIISLLAVILPANGTTHSKENSALPFRQQLLGRRLRAISRPPPPVYYPNTTSHVPTTKATTTQPRDTTTKSFTPVKKEFPVTGQYPEILTRPYYVLPFKITERTSFINLKMTSKRLTSCSDLPSDQDKTCLIITDSNVFTTEVDVKPAGNCSGFSYGPSDNRGNFTHSDELYPKGVFYAIPPNCPTECVFTLSWGHGQKWRSTNITLIVPEAKPLQCPKILVVSEVGAATGCTRFPDAEEGCKSINPPALALRISGTDYDKFFTTPSGHVFARGDKSFDNFTYAALTVKTKYSNLLSGKVNLTYSGLSIYSGKYPVVEASQAFGIIGESITLACSHAQDDRLHTYQWTYSRTYGRRDEIVMPQYSQQKMTLHNLQISNNNHGYRCQFNDTMGKSHKSKKPFLLVVGSKPKLCQNFRGEFKLFDKDSSYLDVLLATNTSESALALYLVAMFRQISYWTVDIHGLQLRPIGNKTVAVLTVHAKSYGRNCSRVDTLDLKERYAEKIVGENGLVHRMFDSRDFLSGSFYRLQPNKSDQNNEESSNIKLTIDSEVLALTCTFISCIEHRKFNSFVWTFNGIDVNELNDPTRFVYKENFNRSSGVLCTTEITKMTLHTEFTKKYFGLYGCMMKVAYGHRVLPWTVNASRQVDIQDPIVNRALSERVTVRPGGCPASTEYGLEWHPTPSGNQTKHPCPKGYSGSITRLCSKEGVWMSPSYEGCIRTELIDIINTVKKKATGDLKITGDEVEAVTGNISSIFNSTKPKLTGDVISVIDIMSDLSHAVTNATGEDVVVNSKAVEDISTIADDLLSMDTEVWAALEKDEDRDDDSNGDGDDKDKNKRVSPGNKLLVSMDSLIKASLNDPEMNTMPIVKEQIVIKRDIVRGKDIIFPDPKDIKSYRNHKEWALNTKTKAFLPASAFQNSPRVNYGIMLYKNRENRFFEMAHVAKDQHLEQSEITSAILSFTIEMEQETLSSGLELEYLSQLENFTDPQCAYLETENASTMAWTSKNCRTEMNAEGRIKCYCKHLTNFAVLMRPIRDEVHHKALSIISLLGCVVSIICLTVTLILYGALWTKVKSPRSLLHVFLCVSLLLVYVLFLAGIEQTDHNAGCLTITVFLHYFLLVSFSIMMTEGVELYLRVKIMVLRKSLGWKLFAPGFVIPLFIVGIAVGSTWDRGYRSPDFCWLNINSGAIWSLIGPIIIVIVANFIIAITVIRAMLSTHSMINLEQKSKAKAVVKAIVIITPLLGFTWILGLFAISRHAIVFHYLFAIFNSLQGLFIFVCHCLLAKQIQDGVKLKARVLRSRYESSLLSTGGTETTARTRQTNYKGDETTELND